MAKTDKKPILKIKRSWNPAEEFHTLEDSRFLFERGPDMGIIVEGQRVASYDELVGLLNEPEFHDKEFIEVVMTPLWPAGG